MERQAAGLVQVYGGVDDVGGDVDDLKPAVKLQLLAQAGVGHLEFVQGDVGVFIEHLGGDHAFAVQ